MYKTLSTLVALCASLTFSSLCFSKETYKIAWTIYAGTMPLGYAQDHGILKKWGEKYGFNLEAVQLNDYIEAQTQFAAGALSASVAISLDALTIPAGSGVDTTVVLPLSTSAGSDGIVMRGTGKTVADLKGKLINLVELSGSHYMLARALSTVGLTEKDVKIINTSDSDIASAFVDQSTQAVATWKPQLSEIRSQFPDTTLVFDSSKIPGEIVDVLIVQTALLKKEPNLGRALVGAWFETMAMMDASHPQHAQFIKYMAAELNSSETSLQSQLSTIDFFTPAEGISYVTSESFKTKMQEITSFAFSHGLLEKARDANYVGIEAGDGKIIGDQTNVKLRFPITWLNEVSK